MFLGISLTVIFWGRTKNSFVVNPLSYIHSKEPTLVLCNAWDKASSDLALEKLRPIRFSFIIMMDHCGMVEKERCNRIRRKHNVVGNSSEADCLGLKLVK